MEISEECNLSLFQQKKTNATFCCDYNVGNFREQAYKAHDERKETARKEMRRTKPVLII